MKNSLKKSLSLLICGVLITAMALFTSGCNDNNTESPATASGSSTEEVSDSTDNTVSGAEDSAADSSPAEGVVTELGEGAVKFTFIVTDGDKNETTFSISTDKTIVGEALQELNLIEGEDSEYGLYVKTVNGITADFNTDGTYWAFYINGEYGMTGVDTTEITEGATYAFKVEK